MTLQKNSLKAAVAAAKKNKSVAISAAEAARKAAEKALARRTAAQALKAEAEELRSDLAEVRRVERFLDRSGLQAKEAAEARLAEIEADGNYLSLTAEIEAAEEASGRAAIEADLAKREAAKKAARSKAQTLVTRFEQASDLFRWVRETGSGRLGLPLGGSSVGTDELRKAFGLLGQKTPMALKATKSSSLWLPTGAIRLEKCQSETGVAFVKVSAVRGQTEMKAGQTWLAAIPSLPQSLRKGLVKAGWVAPAAPVAAPKAAKKTA